MGMWFMDDADVEFEEDSQMDMTAETILSGQLLTKSIFNKLMADNKYPYPNNFFECNILLDRDVDDDVTLHPMPPNGVSTVGCKQNVIAHSIDPVDEELLIGEIQDANEKQNNIDFEAVQTGRFSRTPRPTPLKTERPTKSPKTSKPTKLKTPKPTKTPKTPKPIKVKTPKPSKAPKTPKPTKTPKTPKPIKIKTPKPSKAPRTPRPRPTRLEK